MSGIDAIMWRLAADALNLVTGQVRAFVVAAKVHPEAESAARAKIDSIRSMAAMLLAVADEADRKLSSEGEEVSMEDLVADFAAAYDEGEAAA